ncbi:MAG: tetratricopeptide repeat protein [Clostridiales bacterium]
MRILQILLLLLLCLSNIYSGTPQNNVEKMKSRLNSSGRSLEKIWMLNWLSFEFNKLESRTSQDSSLKYGREALELSKESHFPEGEAEALSNLGYAYFLQNNTSSAKEYLLKALTIAEKIQHRKVMSAINDNLGLVYWKKNDYFLALKHYDEALKDAISSNNEFEHARVLNNLGLIYLKLGKHKQALDNFLESVKIKESLGDQFWLAITYNNLANLYNEMKSYRESLRYSETALEIGKQINISYITARALNNLGSSYDGLLLFDRSLKYFKEALLLKAKTGDTKNLNYVYTLLEIGKRYYNTKNYALSLDYFNRTINLSKDLHNADITSNAFMNLGRSYIKLGDLDLAQSNLDKAMGISKNFKLGKVTRDCYLAYHDL